jgi:hypothetical protein
MDREKKKRMMPRHIMVAAVLTGIIPRRFVENQPSISQEEFVKLDKLMNPPVENK